MRLRLFSLLAFTLILGAGCSSTSDAALPDVAGLATLESDALVSVSFDRLRAALDAAEPVGVVASIDHRQNAANAGLTLRPTRVVLFGNPQLGTPLMQANPQAGLDLPQKMLVYEDAEGRTVVAYNTTDYLAARHGVGGVASLAQIETALDGFAETAAGMEPSGEPSGAGVGRDEGVVTVASENSVAGTYNRLRAAVSGNENLTILAELDHQANAARVGLELAPIRLLVFGNPALGTPLMQAGQTVGIDLPQKMLVYEDDDGEVFIAYNDPAYLAERHRLGTPEQVATIRSALARLATDAGSVDQ